MAQSIPAHSELRQALSGQRAQVSLDHGLVGNVDGMQLRLRLFWGGKRSNVVNWSQERRFGLETGFRALGMRRPTKAEQQLWLRSVSNPLEYISKRFYVFRLQERLALHTTVNVGNALATEVILGTV